jgi:DNA polymerase III epsilon subunit-like protein
MDVRKMIIVIDWETTGLTLHPDAPVHKQPKAIEFGGMALDPTTGEVVRELSQLINPGEQITDEITKITGITNDQLVGMPSFEAFLPQLREFFAGGTGLMAHNVPFDKAILTYELARLGVTDFAWPARELCTVGVYKDAWGRNPRLIELYPTITGKPFEQKHRALDDVRHLVEIIQKEQLWQLI